MPTQQNGGTAHGRAQAPLSGGASNADPTSEIGAAAARIREDVERMRLTPLKEIEYMPPGTRVAFRARVHHIRPLGALLHRSVMQFTTY